MTLAAKCTCPYLTAPPCDYCKKAHRNHPDFIVGDLTPDHINIGLTKWATDRGYKPALDDREEIPVRVEPGYHDLAAILIAALNQAQNGKGSERHARGNAFTDQPILTIARDQGMGFPMGQAQKKIIETAGMLKRGQNKAAERELLGAINYVAAAIIRLHEIDAGKDQRG